MTTRPLLLTLLLLAAFPAQAELADKNKPVQMEADRAVVDDIARTQTLEGKVMLTKGTLVIQADKIVVTQDTFGFQKSIATGGPKGLTHFKQKREGLNSYIEGEAERIEYDGRSEVVEFFRRAWVRSGDDQVKGDYIWYDAVAEKYMVTAGNKTSGTSQRVRAVIQPRSQLAPVEPAPKAPAVHLRGTERLTAPAQ